MCSWGGWIAAIGIVAGCAGAGGTASTTQPQPATSPTPLMSEPAEYDIAHVSRAAGRDIFVRTGFGDPYRTGIPYPIFLAFQRAFPDVFGATPAELAAMYGFIPRPPDPASTDLDVREGLPVGMHLTTDPATGIPFLVTSCALCHAEQVNGALVVGLANKRVRFHAYDRAFSRVTSRARFSAPALVPIARAAAADHHLAWPDTYATPLVGAVLSGLRQRAVDRAELDARTAADPPGRIAAIETFAVTLREVTGREIAAARDVGWVKIPDVVGFAQRTSQSWDGCGEGAMDILSVEAEIGAGVRVAWLERHPFQSASVSAYLRLPPARPPFPGSIDRERAARGRVLFEDNCSRCHGRYGDDGRALDYDDAPVAVDEVGTDPARALAVTDSVVAAANDPLVTHGYTRFRKSGGYVAPVLTNVWARAPYGHAGQWPSLATIATPPEQRAARVVYELGAPYDVTRVGIATRAVTASVGPGEYVEDSSVPGLSVLGHPFLADLGATDASAVIEYLKTL
jgi:mono/diheme cytochrome c family protein